MHWDEVYRRTGGTRVSRYQAVGTGGHAIIGTFAADGPARCSGLPVARYTPEDLAAQFPGYAVACSRREEHHTPGGAVQPFTWLVMTRS